MIDQAPLIVIEHGLSMPWGDERMPKTFWRFVIPEPNSGCYLHAGSQVHGGYTRTFFRGKQIVSHRAVFFAAGGVLPPELELDHRCRVSCCVNLSHSRLASHRFNTLAGETVTAANARATHCIHGHEFTLENTSRRPHHDGGWFRVCRACRRIRRTQRIGSVP